MKKYHLYLWIVALVGLITSCSQDETDALQTTHGESNRVTLTASLPADFVQPQPRSRALPTAPAEHKLRCILEVWDTEDTPALKIRKEICPNAGDTEIDFSFELTTTGTYKVLLWADYIPTNQGTSTKEIAGLAGVSSYGDNYYTTINGLKKVGISITLPTTYPEAGDAFFASAEFTKAEKALTIPTVTLTRPFMKLTIAEKNAQRFASCNQVTARFSTLCEFNVATGNATGTTTFGLPAADGTRNYGTDITIGGKTCKTLICLYVFANAADGTMGDIKLEFTATEQGKSLPDVTIPAGIPLKRNYRVNAAGNLIGEPSSSTVNMTVDINSDWTGQEEYDTEVALAKKVLDAAKTSGSSDNAEDYKYTITTAKQLAAVATLTNADAVITGCTKAKYGYANYKLGNDIDLQSYASWTPIGVGSMFFGTFDGQGHAIRNMNVSITSQTTSEIFGGLFGILLGTVSNLIVEGEVSVNGGGNCSAGGICGRQASKTIKFCRFNGTVSATTTNNDSRIYAGGIIGGYSGVPTITGCIANAKVTISGGKADKSAAGGLAGNAYGTNCKYSAWNSAPTSGGTADMIGKNDDTGGSTGKGNKSFTTISGLNDLLSGINDGVSGSTYIWQAGSTDTDYPVLVQRTPVGN